MTYMVHNFNWKHKTLNSALALNLIDDCILSITNSIWLPQNDFEYFGILELMKKNIKLKEIDELSRGYQS